VNQHITESLQRLPDLEALTADGRGRRIWSQLRQKFRPTKDAGAQAGTPAAPDKRGPLNRLDNADETEPAE
jgi:hypothetical protein